MTKKLNTFLHSFIFAMALILVSPGALAVYGDYDDDGVADDVSFPVK